MLLDRLEDLLDPAMAVSILVGIAAFATVVTLALPWLETDKLRTRMRQVANERDRLRAKMRAQMDRENGSRLRSNPQPHIARIVNRLNLRKLLEGQHTRHKLRMAGLRSERHLLTFLFLRTVLPIAFGTVTWFYLYTFKEDLITPLIHVLITLAAFYFGFYLPNIIVANMIQRRQDSIKQAWSDALDLMLICVESGMSIEAALQKVAREIGGQSVALAEEMTLAHAELSYLPDRKKAFENLGARTGLVTVKAVMTSLIQSERYGTSVGQALRVLAQENRDLRMSEAERKAAALPPKLTVPMVLFFLPVIFIVILGPAVLRTLKIM